MFSSTSMELLEFLGNEFSFIRNGSHSVPVVKTKNFEYTRKIQQVCPAGKFILSFNAVLEVM